MSAPGCGATRETALPTSSRNWLGTRMAAPTSSEKIVTASRITTIPTANWNAQPGTNPTRFTADTPSNHRALVHICQDSADERAAARGLHRRWAWRTHGHGGAARAHAGHHRTY